MTFKVPSLSLPFKLNQQNQAQYQCNIKLLEKIVEAIILCGETKHSLPRTQEMIPQVIPQINVLSCQFLQLLVKHDQQFWSHLQKAKTYALCTSKTIENEVIQHTGNHITYKILKGLHSQ
jgi:hypothetical protein